ncbi:hypothetical protein PENCOP_c008G08534 [Penicillium coprophilum]|uniref:Uncharacterized protein n=1 Tax=Penicillium coprophilum TaxID=36646 RepID=A0A1V6UJE8_9EURO|nr:hypothetical protein PENCOP_c008G08534 [Penicillium coprophilum]
MASVITSQLRRLNTLQRPERDAFGKRNHYHLAVKGLPGVPGEAVFIANPYNSHHEIIVPLLLEAFGNRFDEPGVIPQMASNMEQSAPFTWSTTNESLAQAVSRRRQEMGIRRQLCDIAVTAAEELRSVEA